MKPDLVGLVKKADRQLQLGATVIAEKANSWVGFGNYQLANLFLASVAVRELVGVIVEHKDGVNLGYDSLWAGYSVYRIWTNHRLEKRDEELVGGEAAAIDFKLKEEKKGFDFFALRNSGRVPAKLMYLAFLGVAIGFGNDPGIATQLTFLTSQYFRETDYMGPSFGSKVRDVSRFLFGRRDSNVS